MGVRRAVLALALFAAAVPSAAQIRVPPVRTVATLPAPSPTAAPRLYYVTDGLNASDCTIGGGVEKVLCTDTGTEWRPVGEAASIPGWGIWDCPAGTDPLATIQNDTIHLAATAPLSITGDVTAKSATWSIASASTSAPGVCELATSAETTAGLCVQASDARLADARTPLAHGTTHGPAGSDPLPAGTYVISVTGNAGTADGPSGTPTLCALGSYARGIAGGFAATGCAADDDVPEAGDFGALVLTGPVTSTGLATSIADDAIALGTKTTGDYVSAATTGGGLTKTGTEGATLGLTPCSESQIPKYSSGSWGCGVDASNAGTVTSVGLALPSWFAVTGSPVTGSGTLTGAAATGQASHQVIGTCGSATAFAPCSLASSDLPALTSADLGSLLTNETGSGAAVFGNSPSIVNPVISGFTGSRCARWDSTGSLTAAGADCFDPSAGAILAANGTKGSPAYSWSADPDTGFYKRDTGRITVALDGAALYEFQGNGFILNGANASFGAASGAVDAAGADVYLARVSAGVWGASDSSSAGAHNGWIQWGGQCFLAADATNATASLATTGCSISVKSGRKYAFRCSLSIADSVAGEGLQFDAAGGSATATNFWAHFKGFDSAALGFTMTSTTLSGAASVATFTGRGEVEVDGALEPSSNGTFALRFAQNSHSTGTATLYRGSHCLMWDFP